MTVSEQQRAEAVVGALRHPDRVAAVQATGLLDAPGVEALDRLVALAARLLGAPRALLSLVDADRSRWLSTYGIPGPERELPAHEALCQYVVHAAGPVRLDDTSTVGGGEGAWAGAPVRGDGGHVLGALCVADPQPRAWTDAEEQVLAVLAEAATAHVALHTAEQRERAARAQVEVLSDASALLLSDLDPDAVLERLTGLAVPALARWCSVWLPTGDGRLRAAAVAGPPGQAWSWPDVPLDSPSLSARAYRSRRPESMADGTAALLAAMPDSPLTASSVAAGCGPAHSVPLLVHGRVLGSLTLLRHRDDPPFSDADRTFAAHLAGRAGQALSLAQQHAGQREAARVLQRSLLPRLPDVPGLAVHATYRPAGGIDVGGDWFDLLALPGGRVALLIGDVMGRGVPAAAVMGQVRSAARAYVRMQVPPAEVLGLLDQTVGELTVSGEDDPLVTCFLGVLDLPARSLTWASAGHLPPVALGDGAAGSLAGPVGAPLGVGPGVAHADTTTVLPPGALLVMFTDGLVEDRRRDLDVGLDLVRTLVERADPADLDGLARTLLAHVAGDEEDDVALLMVRLAPA